MELETYKFHIICDTCKEDNKPFNVFYSNFPDNAERAVKNHRGKNFQNHKVYIVDTTKI